MKTDRKAVLSQFPLEGHLSTIGVKMRGGGAQRTATTCPAKAHRTDHWCVSIDLDRELWHCNSCQTGGSIIDWIAIERGVSASDIFKEMLVDAGVGGAKDENFATKARSGDEGPIVATYDYTNELGELVYQVTRHDPKTFRQRRPDQHGGWIKDMKGVQRVLYRLPDVLNSQETWVCYDPTTEVLTPKGWVLIGINPETVAQYDPTDGQISFVVPERWIKTQFNGDLVSLESKTNSFAVTPEHRMLVRTSDRTKAQIRQADKLKTKLYYPRCGLNAGGETDLSIEQVRLLAAFQADGTVTNRHREKKSGDPFAWQHPAFTLKKERKKSRLRKILADAKVDWVEQNFNSSPEWTLFILRRDKCKWLLENLDDDAFQWRIMEWPLNHRQALLDELKYWDGDSTKKSSRFFTSSRQAADVVQAIAVTSGWYASIRRQVREERPQCQPELIVQLIPNRLWRQEVKAPTRIPYNGPVHCCKVPNGFLLTRRHGKVLIAGNCEGEKDCDNLHALGLTATCNVGGAGAWMEGYAESLRGKDIVLCGDKDTAGKKYIDDVRKSLEGKVRSTRTITIPDPHKDISDYLATFADDDAACTALAALRAASPPISRGIDIPVFSMRELERGYAHYARNAPTVALYMDKWLPKFRNIRPIVPGEVVMFLAETGVGKTALLSNLAIHAAPLTTLFFELELPDTLLFERTVAAHMNIRCDSVEEQYRENLNFALLDTELAGLSHLFFCPVGKMTVELMEELIIRSELKTEKKVQLVLVDYIQLIDGKAKERYERVSDAAEALKQLARRTQTIIVCASQVGRKKEDTSRVVTLHDGKGSGSIENSAGLIIGAWRDEDDHNTLWLQVLKNTKGKSGLSIECDFDGARMRITQKHSIMAAPTPSPETNGDQPGLDRVLY